MTDSEGVFIYDKVEEPSAWYTPSGRTTQMSTIGKRQRASALRMTTVIMEMLFELTEALKKAVEYCVSEGTAEILEHLAEYLANEQSK